MDESFKDQSTLTSPAKAWATLTPSDEEGAEFPFLPKAIAVGAVAGTFYAVDEDGNEAPFYGNKGQIIQIRPRMIKVTGLTGGMTFTGLIK